MAALRSVVVTVLYRSGLIIEDAVMDLGSLISVGMVGLWESRGKMVTHNIEARWMDYCHRQ